MQQHEIIYDAIIEDLIRVKKILDPEDLAITYLNIFPDTYSSFIQSMKSILVILTSQNIKTKIREEEQRFKNIVNDNDEQTPNPNNITTNTIKSQKKKKIKTK